jgi:hypothetical protein
MYTAMMWFFGFVTLLCAVVVGNGWWQQRKQTQPLPLGGRDAPKSEAVRALIGGSKRTLGLLLAGVALFAVAALVPETGLLGVLMRGLMAIGALFVAAAVVHRLRMMIAPYLDLRKLVETAQTEPVAAAIVAAAMLMFVAMLVSGVMSVFAYR